MNSGHLLNWYQYEQLDVLLLQEVAQNHIRPALPPGCTLDCQSQLCVVTQHTLTRRMKLDRTGLVGWGPYAILYQLDGRDHSLPPVNIHLHTPRWIVLTQKAPLTNFRRFQRLYGSYAIESMLASALVEQEQGADRAIFAGKELRVRSSQVHPSLGGNHSPVIPEIEL